MKILHVVASISEHDGGPGLAALEVCRILNNRGHKCFVATTDFDGPDKRLSLPHGTPSDYRGVEVLSFPMEGRSESQKKSSQLEAWLLAHSGKFDLIHIHGLFSHPTRAAVKGAMAAGVPYVFGPCGALMQPNLALSNPKNLLKRAYIMGVENKHLEGAGAIAYTSRLEMELSNPAVPAASRHKGHILQLGLAPEAMEQASNACLKAAESKPGKPMRIGFLGRLHPIKGFETWLPALGSLYAHRAGGAFTLSLAGPPTEWSASHLDSLLEKVGLGKKTNRIGRLDGDAKWEYLANLDSLLLPSYLENFGLVAVEAMACGTAVLVTDRVGVADEVRATGAGWVVAGDQSDFEDLLLRLLRDPDRVRDAGRKGPAVVAERFGYDVIARQIDEVYRSLGSTMVGE